MAAGSSVLVGAGVVEAGSSVLVGAGVVEAGSSVLVGAGVVAALHVRLPTMDIARLGLFAQECADDMVVFSTP